MKKLIQVIISCVFFIQISNAQEPLTHNLYTVNPFIFNPAATGSEGALSAFLDIYRQWTGFSTAPKVSTFGIHSPVTDKMSLGLMIYNDQRCYLNHLSGLVNYSFKVKFNEDMGLALGLALGFMNNKVDFSDIRTSDPADPLYNSTEYNKTKLAAGAGLAFKYKALNIHFSLPEMIEQGKHFLGQYNFIALYDIKANKQLIIRPSVLIRAFPGNIMQSDINVMADWKKMLWGQVGYRTDKSILGSLGLKFKGLGIGYCYQSDMGDVKKIAAATHEIMISYTFKKKEPKKPVVKQNPNADKVDIVANMKDEKYGTPVKGTLTIKKNKIEVGKNKADNNGVCHIFVEPGIYTVDIEAKGYIPITDTLDLRNMAKGTSYTYNLKPIKIEKGLVFKFAGVNFETNSDVLLPESKEILDMVSIIFIDYPKMKVQVAGHTDNVGEIAFNQTLSEKRAISVANYLKSKGIKEKQIVTIGFGETKPISDNNTTEGRQKNRRVEFTVIEF